MLAPIMQPAASPFASPSQPSVACGRTGRATLPNRSRARSQAPQRRRRTPPRTSLGTPTDCARHVHVREHAYGSQTSGLDDDEVRHGVLRRRLRRSPQRLLRSNGKHRCHRRTAGHLLVEVADGGRGDEVEIRDCPPKRGCPLRVVADDNAGMICSLMSSATTDRGVSVAQTSTPSCIAWPACAVSRSLCRVLLSSVSPSAQPECRSSAHPTPLASAGRLIRAHRRTTALDPAG